MDPLLSSSMQQAAYKYEMPRLELKSLPSFLAIKCCQQMKNQEVINPKQSLSKKLVHICTSSDYPVNIPCPYHPGS
jgi:hypothetical protein